MQKFAGATSVPFADSAVDTASASPIPGLAVGNKPAPGLSGPKGLAPRTNYSRVNTGSPPPADGGASSQKSMSPDPQSFLPPKVAHSEVPMTGTMSPRVTLQQMIKSAAEGARSQAMLSMESMRQLANQGESVPQDKTASAATEGGFAEESIPTAYVEKFAAAVEYVVETLKQASPGPGEGPNALSVSKASDPKNSFAPGASGSATPGNQVPKNPGTHKPAETPHGPATALDTNATRKHAAADVVDVAELRKLAGTLGTAARGAAEGAKRVGKAVAASPLTHGGAFLAGAAGEKAYRDHQSKKEAAVEGVNPRLVDFLLGHVKQAEDAINPAHISAGPAVAPETSAAGESGGAPAGGQPQGPTGLVGSNESATNYTKGQAKANVKPDLHKVLSEPALSSAHDHTLTQAFAHTGEAGVKISESLRAMSARAILEKMAEEAKDEDGKKKKSMGGAGSFSAPPVGGAAGTM